MTPTWSIGTMPSNAYLSSLLGEITIGVVVGVLGDVRVGVDSLHPVEKDHQSTGGKTLK